MKAILLCEHYNNPLRDRSLFIPEQSWVRVVGGGYVRGQMDYSELRGSRGIMRGYVIESGRVYEVFRRLDWMRFERFFCTVDDGTGEIKRL